MTSKSKIVPLNPSDLSDYGHARVRDVAFDAVLSLWHRRKETGMKQSDIAAAIGRDPGWVSRNLRGPGNWTFKTFGAFLEALNGEIEMQAFGKEDQCSGERNFHANDDYTRDVVVPSKTTPLRRNDSKATPSIRVPAPV